MSKLHETNRCALTGLPGSFVKCHIIPQAFTKPSIKGEALYQSTKGRGERRRWSSWYDKKLVTREGEDILSSIDNKAVNQLRKHQLVWSGWAGFRPRIESLGPLMADHGYRKVYDINSEPIIRFALSVAWRAAASSMPDMDNVTLTPEIQDMLKEYVLGAEIKGPSKFPVSLIQISSLGEIHNQSPYTDEKKFIDLDNKNRDPLKIIRVYMDGLIFHVHISPIPADDLSDNSIFLGTSDHVMVTTISYEASFQYENLLHLMRESFL